MTSFPVCLLKVAPPVTRACPFDSMVRDSAPREVFKFPVLVHAWVEGSHSSAELTLSVMLYGSLRTVMKPPATSTLPVWSSTPLNPLQLHGPGSRVNWPVEGSYSAAVD